MKKIFKNTLFILIISILLIPIFLFITLYLMSRGEYYYLVDYEEKGNIRYTLYVDQSWDGDSYIIVEQDINYKEIEKIKMSSISLIQKKGDKNNRYIYHFITPDSTYNSYYKTQEIDIFKDQYLTLSLNGKHHFLYNLINKEKYSNYLSNNGAKLTEDFIHMKIIEMVE